MILVPSLAKKQVAVFGLGKAGMAVVESLIASGAEVFAWDDHEASRDRVAMLDVTLLPPERMPWKSLVLLVLSPGVPYTHPVPHTVVQLAHKAECPIICDVELLYRACPKATYVAITGTNGKSTTTALVGHIFKEAGVRVQVGGNIGTPAMALEPLGDDGVYVLEVSSYQLDLLHTFRAHIAVLLNITPDHLERHGGMDGYVAVKSKVFNRQIVSDTAILGVDDAPTREICEHLRAWHNGPQVVPVSVEHSVPGGVYVLHGVLRSTICDGSTPSFDINPIASLVGQHNWQNAAVAMAVALRFGIDWEVLCRAMETFAGLAHRMEQVAVVDGVRFVNDSKATNVEAAAKALACYSTIYWIAGGLAKQGDDLGQLLPLFQNVKAVYLIGEAEEVFAQALHGSLEVHRCGTLESAVEQAAGEAFAAGDGGVVLLSPACASFDQWRNFEDRGDAFKAYVGRVESFASRHPAT